jgi:molybdenum cofactor cytidylyltransferase
MIGGFVPKVDAIVPGAGHSRRMGTRKLLLPFAGTTVIGHVVRVLRATPVRSVVVVVPPGGEAIAGAAKDAGACTVVNPDPGADMLSSVRCGVRALPGDCDAALVAPGDQPTLRALLVEQMITAFETAAGGIVVPTHAGRRGHPVLIGSCWFGEILVRYDGVGLRGLLADHPGSVVEVDSGDEEVLHDMDDPEGYARALRAQP